MENNQDLEQPSAENVKVNEPIIEKEDNKVESSDLGKFKDAKSLYSAYVSLEKEFTRKSQKLAMLSKVSDSEKTQNSINESENNASAEANEPKINENVPEYLKPTWRTNVNSFLAKNPDAKSYLGKISGLLIENQELAQFKNCLPIAYELARAKERPADLSDPKLVSVILKDENIKNQIINEYILSLKSDNTKPKLMSGEQGSTMLTPIPTKPKTLKEANDIFKRLLQS